MLDSCCLSGHVDFAFSYVFLGTHVSSCRSALEITKILLPLNMHSCMYTLDLCVHSYRDAHHKQTFASISFEKNKSIFPSLHRKVLHPKRGRATSSLLLSIPLIPAAFWDLYSSVPHFWKTTLSTALWTPLLGLTEEQKGVLPRRKPFPAMRLACNTAFPHRGASKCTDNFTLLLPSLWSIPSGSCGKAQFLGKQQILT